MKLDTSLVGLDFTTTWAYVNGTNDEYACLRYFCLNENNSPNPDEATTGFTDETPTGKRVIIHWSNNSGCQLSNYIVKAESTNTVQDFAYNYPNGLTSFTFSSCTTPSVTIDLTFVDVTGTGFKLRKYTPATQSYATVSADSITNITTVDNHPAVKVSYTIVDNGPYDTNPALGTISDPAGIAQAVIGAPQTGEGGTAGK